MPLLGDYLGQLLSEIAMARMRADLETIRLAELYATHPLLRTMPVPHLRLPEIDLDIPVLIRASEEPREGASPRGGASFAVMRQKFDEVFVTYLATARIALSPVEARRLRAALDEREAAGVPTEVSVDVSRVADDLIATALRILDEVKPRPIEAEPLIPASLEAELRDALRIEFLKLRTPPPRLSVLVTSAELREAGTAENVIRLRLKVSEQGLEWTTTAPDGRRPDRLVPE